MKTVQPRGQAIDLQLINVTFQRIAIRMATYFNMQQLEEGVTEGLEEGIHPSCLLALSAC